MVDPERLQRGDVVRYVGERDLRETGPDGADHLIAQPGDIGEVVMLDPWRGWLGEALSRWFEFRVRSYSVVVAFPDAPFGPVDCRPEELAVIT